MATVINNPTPTDSDRGVGVVTGAIVLIFLLILFIFVGMPMLSQAGLFRSPQINVPQGNQNNTPPVNLPNKIDVNINKGQ